MYLPSLNSLSRPAETNQLLGPENEKPRNHQATTTQVGCSDFFVHEGLLVGRTLDFPSPILSRLVKIPVGEKLTSKDPEGNPAYQWTSQYGIVGLTAFGDENNGSNIIDGMNTEGLKIGSLSLEETVYQTVPNDQMNKAMALSDSFVWLLGTCATIEDVKKALSEVYIWGDIIPPMQTPYLQHYSIHDKTGASLVVEYINGELRMYDNPVHMLTNDPPFPEQLENLRTYDYLNTAFEEGQNPGTGMKGLPGDYTTTSRFVRGATLLKFAKKCEDAFHLAMTILGSLEVPLGLKLAFTNNDKDYDATRWKTISDLANLTFYYMTIQSRGWTSVDLKQLDFSTGSGRTSIPIFDSKQNQWATSVTDQLNKASNPGLWQRFQGLIFG